MHNPPKVAFIGKKQGFSFMELTATIFEVNGMEVAEIPFFIQNDENITGLDDKTWSKTSFADLSPTAQDWVLQERDKLIQAAEELLADNNDVFFVPGSWYNVPVSAADVVPAAEMARSTIEKIAIDKSCVEKKPIIGICNGALRLLAHDNVPLSTLPEERRGLGVVPKNKVKSWIDSGRMRGHFASGNDDNVFIDSWGEDSNVCVHSLNVAANSVYGKIVALAKGGEIADGHASEVYSAHKQYCPAHHLPRHIKSSATSDDGIEEVFEWQNHPLRLGFLYHPETGIDRGVFNKLSRELADYCASRKAGDIAMEVSFHDYLDAKLGVEREPYLRRAAGSFSR